jgi:hypothetical protein
MRRRRAFLDVNRLPIASRDACRDIITLQERESSIHYTMVSAMIGDPAGGCRR